MTATATPPSDCVLILGGGLMGLALAHQLARRGRSVLVLSRRRSEAAGFVAAGMLAPHAEGLGGALLALGQASLERIPAWVAGIEADSGLGCGLRPCGIVVPFATAAERDAYPTATWGRALERPALEREIPGIGPLWRTGLLFEQDGQIDNRRRLMRALERACVQRGVRFEEGSEVLELITAAGSMPSSAADPAPSPKPGPGTAPLADSRPSLEAVRLRRADGSELTLACRAAVLACGAWSAHLLPQLPVFPVKGQMLSLQGPIGALPRVVFGPGTYLVPREDGLLVVGATSEPEAGFAEGLTPFGQQRLEAGIAALLPAASQWPPMERWWGFRPCTPDEGPLLGPGPIAGLWLATGHHRNGVLLAAFSSELVAREISREPGPDDGEILSAFRWDRFAATAQQPR
ncbi:MAG: FAD-dependent oxidoreductase [Synechococcaceae cyanobacterium ELA182]